MRQWLVTAVAAYFVVLAISGYRHSNVRSDGPEWAAACLHAAQESCRSEGSTEVVIPIAPVGWFVSLPCDRITSSR